MSATEIIVVLFGLFVGYWVVAKLFPDKKKDDHVVQPPEDAPVQPPGENSRKEP